MRKFLRKRLLFKKQKVDSTGYYGFEVWNAVCDKNMHPAACLQSISKNRYKTPFASKIKHIKIDFQKSKFKNRFPKIEIQKSISENRNSKIDFQKSKFLDSILENRCSKVDFLESVFKSTFIDKLKNRFSNLFCLKST